MISSTNLSINLDNILRIIDELEKLEKKERNYKKKIEKIYNDYENKKYDYNTLKKKINELLKGKTEKKFFEEIKEYKNSLLRTLKHENEKIIFHFYHIEPRILKEMQDESFKITPKKEIILGEEVKKEIKKEEEIKKPKEIVETKIEEKYKIDETNLLKEEKKYERKKEISFLVYFKNFIKELFKPAVRLRIPTTKKEKKERIERKKEIAKVEEKLRTIEKKPIVQKKTVLKLKPISTEQIKKEKEEIIKEKIRTPSTSVRFALINPFIIFKKRIEKSKKVISDKTEIPITIETVGYREKTSEALEKTYLKKEAERIQKILETERAYRGYSTTIITSIANIMVKRISLKLLNTFPLFFKKFYKRLREANIGLLSNTYLNLMVFFTLFSFIVSFTGSAILFFMLYDPFYMILIKSIITSIITATIIFFIFYTHPNFIIAKKKKGIEMNMPFAINHMSAIATAGVPPITIFKLVVEKKEYGEFSEQIERIVDYVEVFGVNLLLAIKTVASTSPSPYFKEFLEGLASSIESGVGVEKYLKQKAKESLTRYNLERKKYNETIATFSDIYTAVLVAAPLLFIATLAMVNLLGGKIAGLGISTLMLIGVYIIIPLLNIIFILFIKATQPGV